MSAIKPIPLRVYRIEYQPSPVILDYQGMKIGFPDLVLRELNRQSEHIAYLQAERDNRDKTLNDIARALGLEAGDVDGIAGAIEGLKRDALRYQWLKETLHSAKAGGGVEVNDALMCYEQPEPGKEVRIYWYPDTPIVFYEIEARTLDEAIDKALAAGEAG